MKRWISLTIIGFSLALAVIAYITHYIRHASISYVEDKATYGTPDIGGPFMLLDQHNKPRTDKEFKGKIMFVYFGYSFCPDICPMGLQNMSQALTLLARDAEQIAPLFITIDPERDTPESLKTYAANWHSSMIFLTGSPEEVGKAVKAYKVYAAKAKPDKTVAEYLLDHSTLIYIMDREGKFLEAHPHSTDPEKLAKALRKYLK